MIVLGFDPGLAHTGWGIIHANRGTCEPLAYGCISTNANAPLTERLSKIYNEMTQVVEKYHPQSGAMKGIFFGVNAKSALLLGEARASALLALAQQGVVVSEYSPTQVKQTIVGNGRAEKSQVAYMVKTLLHFDHQPQPDHCSDALAIALTHATMAGF